MYDIRTLLIVGPRMENVVSTELDLGCLVLYVKVRTSVSSGSKLSYEAEEGTLTYGKYNGLSLCVNTFHGGVR